MVTLKIFGNPRIKIPQILETDINDKIIIAYKVTPEGNRFLNYMIKNKNGTLSFRGSSKNSYNDDKWSNAVTWTDSYNNGHTIMDLLIKEYDKMRDIDWSTTHYVLENRADLNDILQAYDLGGELRTELEKLGAKIFSPKP